MAQHCPTAPELVGPHQFRETFVGVDQVIYCRACGEIRPLRLEEQGDAAEPVNAAAEAPVSAEPRQPRQLVVDISVRITPYGSDAAVSTWRRLKPMSLASNAEIVEDASRAAGHAVDFLLAVQEA